MNYIPFQYNTLCSDLFALTPYHAKKYNNPVLGRENSSWVNPAFMKKLIWACLPTTSDTSLEKLHLIHYLLLHVHCKQILQTKEWKMTTLKMGAPKARWSTWCFPDVLMSPRNSLTLCQINRSHQTSEAKANKLFKTLFPCAWRSKK